MLKPFSSHQKTKAIYNSTNNNNSNEFYNFSHQYSYHHSHSYHQKKSVNTTTTNSVYFQKRTLLQHKSKHQKQNTFFIIIVGLLSLCSVTVSSQVSRAQNISNLVAQIVSPADPFNSTPIYLNESWWPTNIPLELYHSNRGTLQQQIIGVPPSWGVGCPTPGNTPPVRGISSSSDDNNNNTISDNKLNQETKLGQIENDNSPYYSCPAPCPLTTTINIIKMGSVNFNSPSYKNDDDVNDSSTNSYSSKPINKEQKGEQKFKHPPYFNQCLHYLQPSVFETLCKKDNQSIYEFGRKISKLRLPFCCEHTVESVVMASLQQPDFNVMIEEVDDFNNEVPVSLLRNFECIRHLESLLTLDRLARKAAAMFDSVLERYDCGQTYSVNFRCEDCKDAYRRWVCASLLPYHEPHRVPVWPAPSAVNPAENKQQQQEVGTGRSPRPRRRRRAWRKVRPCRVVCQQVEQRCPFFLPGDRAPGYTTQYAGEPTFLCLDPNIPETGEQYERSAYGHDECCYRYCDTAESVASMLRKSEHPIQRQRKQGRLHGVCSTTTACDQRELLLVNNNNNKINNNINNYNNNNSRRIDSSLSSSSSSLNTSSTNLISSSSSTSNNNNNNENNNNYSHNKQPHHQLQCSQLTNEEKVHQKNCAVSPPSSQQTNTQQQSVNTNNKYNKNKFNNNNNDNNPFHHHHEIVVDSFEEDAKTSSISGDVNSAGVSFIHIHSLNKNATALVARQTTNRLLLLLFKNNDNNNITDNSITISNRLPSSFLQWWWFSIVTIIIRIINLSSLFLAHLPYMLLFLLVHTRTTEGYL